MRKHRWLMLLALLVAALARGRAAATTTTAAATAGPRTPRRTQSSSQIQKNDKNSSTKLTIGSKNFTEQKVLGEIYAQALAAAGYTVKNGAQPRRREDGAQGAQGRRDQRATRSTPAPRCCRSSACTADKTAERRARRPTSRPRRASPRRASPRCRRRRSRAPTRSAVTKETADKLGLQEDLGPEGQVAGKLTLYGTPGVPPAAGLPARPRAGLRPEVQEVRAGRHRPAPRGARRRARPTCRSCSRPTRRSSATASRPARGRQGHVPALQLDARRA